MVDAGKVTLARALFKSEGLLTAAQLAESLGVSQPTVSRLLHDIRLEIVRIGKGRSSRYGLLREALPEKSNWPLYFINEDGQAEEIGLLYTLEGGSYYLGETDNWPSLKFSEEFQESVFPGLPWFLYDTRLQGFQGRLFARAAKTLRADLPDDPRIWNSEQILWSLVTAGNDFSGSLILGDTSLALYYDYRSPIHTLKESEKQEGYSYYTKRIGAGELIGSSAGGEQPKFSIAVSSDDRNIRHVIVKYSPKINTEAGRRWADLLVAEHIAIKRLGEFTNQPVQTEILFDDERCYLESTRFDRVGDWGRRAVVSLEAVDGAFIGQNGVPWVEQSKLLVEEGLLDLDDQKIMDQYWWYGTLIANTDMHYGNLLFFLNREMPLSLAPPYDMLPMLYAPGYAGEIIDLEFRPKLPLPRHRNNWREALPHAIGFWNEVASDKRISKSFCKIAEVNASKLVVLEKS